MVRTDALTLKSPNDRKLYRLCTLDNGLQALLVHDPEIGQQQQHQAQEQGHAPEASDEDVDSLLSGGEEEEDDGDSGSEVRHSWGKRRAIGGVSSARWSKRRRTRGGRGGLGVTGRRRSPQRSPQA